MTLDEARPDSADQMGIATRQGLATSGAPCPSCGNPNQAVASGSFIYALGRIEPRFPSLSVEKEFAQATGPAETANLADREALHAVLSKPENRYVARQLCWLLTIEGLDVYVIVPRDPTDFHLLLEAVRPRPSPMDVDVVIGVKGPIAPPDMCGGLSVPVVAFDQIYSFDRDAFQNALIKSVQPPEKIPPKEFEALLVEGFNRIMQVADNAGQRDTDRALNYLAVRYPAIYAKAAEGYAQNVSLTAVDVLPSRLGGVRRIVDVVFSYTNRSSDVTEKVFCRVDVTGEFPFLVTRLSPYYDCET